MSGRRWRGAPSPRHPHVAQRPRALDRLVELVLSLEPERERSCRTWARDEAEREQASPEVRR